MEKDLSIETNPRSEALFSWEREANISKLPSQKFQKQPPLAIYRKIDFSKIRYCNVFLASCIKSRMAMGIGIHRKKHSTPCLNLAVMK